MNVCFFCSSPDIQVFDQSGAGTHIRGVTNGFEQLGHRVDHLFAGDECSTSREAQSDSSLRKGHLASFLRSRASLAWQTTRDLRVLASARSSTVALEQRLKRGDIHLVYERATYLQGRSTRISARFGIPHIVELNSPLVEERRSLAGRSMLERLGQRTEAALLRNADRVVVVSSPLQQWVHQRYPAVSDVVVAPNATEFPLCPPGRIPDRGGLVRIGFVGSMLDWHRLDLLIEAVSRVHLSGEMIEVVLVGDGPSLPSVCEAITESGLSSVVRAMGSVPHDLIPEILVDWDIGVLAGNKPYGSPTKLLEYAAAGLAIVAPDEPGTRDLFDDHVNALLVAPRADDLAEALVELVRSSSLRQELGRNALETAAGWRWVDVIDRMLEGLNPAPGS